MTYKISCAAAVAAAVLIASPAQSADDQHAQHQQQSAKSVGMQQSEGSKALHEAMSSGMTKMHNMKMTGKTDQDFATMMIQHHEQAIAMAKVELDHGADPQVQKKAREIMTASEKDIAELKKWQK
ncbi:DUF305 domain-containing protein [Steroidobacter sp.]|uniref:DUF305 domain-containing protein n=1 Tax=Steroidobacter sp. TaxID=1978227 RepID=UPI001A61856F|nr:DUF305 domain-containing protein [Steroidobacter sp.]MBL8265701.1 DUF305 domain-containing protein [Steroidobacter sp.]